MAESLFELIHILKRTSALLLGLVFTLSLLACEDKETNAIAKAQECLDKARTSSDADGCRSLVEGKNSQQAYIIRCSIEFVSGGLTTSTIAKAFSDSKESTSNKEAQLMALLSLGDTTKAESAAAFCKLSGIPGLIYLANLSVIGTYMTQVSSDPASFLTSCATSGCNDEAVGTAVISLAETYCTGANENSDVCSKVNTAVTSANGNAEAIAKEFYSQLNNK